MGIIEYFILLTIGTFRRLFPQKIQNVIIKYELRFANHIFWFGMGIDDAVTEYIKQNEYIYKPALLSVVLNSIPGSDTQNDAFMHLITFLNDSDIRKEIKIYSDTKATPEFKKQIENILLEANNWN